MPRHTKRIVDLPPTTRPQEKLFAKGSTALTEAELVAVLLNTGTAKHNAVQLAQILLKKIPLHLLSRSTFQEKAKRIPGIGPTKIARIAAALELGDRVYGQPSLKRTYIRSTADILAQVKDIAHKKQEHLVVLYLNARQELIQKETIAIGNVNVLAIEIKEVITPALLTPCTSIVVAHNHPSGDPTPSDADIVFTTRLQEAVKLVSLLLIDHLIVCDSAYFSFAEEK